MTDVVNFNLRLERELRDQASEVLEGYGMTTAQALRLFLVYVAKTKKIPLSFDYQSDELILGEKNKQAIRQGREDYLAGKLERYSPNEAIAAIQELARG